MTNPFFRQSSIASAVAPLTGSKKSQARAWRQIRGEVLQQQSSDDGTRLQTARFERLSQLGILIIHRHRAIEQQRERTLTTNIKREFCVNESEWRIVDRSDTASCLIDQPAGDLCHETAENDRRCRYRLCICWRGERGRCASSPSPSPSPSPPHDEPPLSTWGGLAVPPLRILVSMRAINARSSRADGRLRILMSPH